MASADLLPDSELDAIILQHAPRIRRVNVTTTMQAIPTGPDVVRVHVLLPDHDFSVSVFNPGALSEQTTAVIATHSGYLASFWPHMMQDDILNGHGMIACLSSCTSRPNAVSSRRL